MPTKAQTTDALHRYLDGLEDLQLEALLQLVEAIDGIPREAWLTLTQPDRVRALADRLAAQVMIGTLPSADRLAAATTGDLTGKNYTSQLQSLQSQAPAAAPSAILDPVSTQRAVRRMSASINAVLADSASQVERLIIESPPTTRERSMALLDRIEAEVIAPLRSVAAWRDATRESVQAAATDTLSVGGERLRNPRLSAAAAARRAEDQPMLWVAALVSTCQDCLPRHGQTKPMSTWRRLGLPRSGWSVCQRNCKCMLVPAFAVGAPGVDEMIEPLMREKMRLVDEGSPRGLSVRVPDDLLQRDPAAIDSSVDRRATLREAYAEDVRVRRAVRLLGRINRGRASVPLTAAPAPVEGADDDS